MLEFIGDSHIIALRDAAMEPGMRAKLVAQGPLRMAQLGHGYNFLEPFFSAEASSLAFTQDAANKVFRQINHDMPGVIERNDRRRFVFVFGLYPSFGFNAEHWMSHTAALWSADRQFVSKSAFDAIIDETLKEPMSFFTTLKSMNVRFSVASCCPIPASYQTLAGKTNYAENEVAFIYNRFRDRTTERLNAQGIFCHHPPAEVYDENGAMRDEFVKAPGDYHANPEYGRLMLSKIMKEVASLQ